MRSPALNVPATARLNASVSVVMLAPKTILAGSPPSSVATCARARSSRASQASDAANAPPVLALSPLAAHVAIASMAVSTICVPAGPSKRAQPSHTPGNRRRMPSPLMAGVCHHPWPRRPSTPVGRSDGDPSECFVPVECVVRGGPAPRTRMGSGEALEQPGGGPVGGRAGAPDEEVIGTVDDLHGRVRPIGDDWL